MKFELRYLSEELDRHGNVRLYVRPNGKRVRMKMLPSAPGFIDEYKAALVQLDGLAQSLKASNSIGTVGWLVNEFEHSHDFLSKDLREQRVRHQLVAAMLDEETKTGSGRRFRDCPIALFTADHVRLLRDRKRTTPSMGNKRIKNLRIILGWGLEERSAQVKRNVAKDVKKLKYDSDGFRPWTEEEAAKFETRFLVGTMGRLALDLLLYTGARRSDVVTLGPPLVSEVKNKATGENEKWIAFTPGKTKKSTGKEVVIPILDALLASIAATPHGLHTYLVTAFGVPFASGNSFANWFKDRCKEAGLPADCSPYGLRKIAAERAAENGATEQQMMAIFGWSSSKLASFYAKKANQKKLASAAIGTLKASG